jgi:hypothetical protein
MNDLNKIISSAELTIVAAAINKKKLANSYVIPENPYELALKFCMERAFRFLDERSQTERVTHVIVEKRGLKEDRELVD